MLECPNCGSGLRFHVPSQKVACDACKSQFEPASFNPQKADGEEVNSFDVTVFACPQCGGEVYSTDDTIAGFCSFCGASTILTSRIQAEKRPHYVIPFAISKERCKNAYAKMMKKAIFAPKELKSPEFIDGFRGIYMPYWAYYVDQSGPFNFPAKKEYRRGDYIYTDTYQLSGQMDSYYKGISYDASSSFDDSISETLAPYDLKGMKGFTPAYLAGFYADTADLDDAVYADEAKWMAYEETVTQMGKHPFFKPYSNDYKTRLHPEQFNTTVATTDFSLFPVWFMSYRSKNRVAYATVNGQTGKVVADIPISLWKYLLGSLILSIPLALFFLIAPFIMPWQALTITSVIAVISLFIYSSALKKIERREGRLDDIGYLFKHNPQKYEEIKRQPKKVKTSVPTRGATNSKKIMWLIIAAQFAIPILLSVFSSASSSSSATNFSFITIAAWLFIIISTICVNVSCFKRFDRIPGKAGRSGIIFTLIALIIASAIRLLSLPFDYYYYIGCIILLVAIFVTLSDIFRAHNVYSTRRLPQFDHRGGDDRA